MPKTPLAKTTSGKLKNQVKVSPFSDQEKVEHTKKPTPPKNKAV
jgi:hypothetical protein